MNQKLIDHPQETTQFVTFNLGKEILALNVCNIESIERMTPITRIPTSPSHVLGVINLRGDIIPVVNIHQILGLDKTDNNDKTRIIITHLEGFRVGVVVDSIIEVSSIPIDSIQTDNNLFENRSKEYIEGVYEKNGTLILILDINKILPR